MKKSVTLFAALLLVVFATGCTINVDVEEDDLDTLNEVLDEIQGDHDNDQDGDIDADDDKVDLEVVTDDDDDSIEPTGALDGPVTVTVEEGENMNEYLTYLKRTAYEEDWFDRDSGTCQYFYEMKTDESFPVTVEDFEDEGVQRTILETMDDKEQAGALIAQMVDYLEGSEKNAYQFCSGRNGVFVIFGESHTSVTLTVWDEEELTLEELETFDGLIDLSYSFETDAIGAKAIMMTGYGDAGHLSWNYFLINTRNNSVQKVESCNGSSSSSGENGEYHDQFTFECEMEYTG